jgi:hypothetical protein
LEVGVIPQRKLLGDDLELCRIRTEVVPQESAERRLTRRTALERGAREISEELAELVEPRVVHHARLLVAHCGVGLQSDTFGNRALRAKVSD